jgi:hypothetical protein
MLHQDTNMLCEDDVPHNPNARPDALPVAREKIDSDVPAALANDRLVDAGQLAALIGVDKRTIFRWKAAGHVPGYDFQCGQTCRWKISTVRNLIAQPHKLRRRAC